VLPDLHRGAGLDLLKHDGGNARNTGRPGASSGNLYSQQLGRSRNPITQSDGPGEPRPTLRPTRQHVDHVTGLLATPVQPVHSAPPPAAAAVLPMLHNPERRAVAQEHFNYKQKVQEKYAAMFDAAAASSREMRNAGLQHRLRERTSNPVFYMPDV